MARVADGRSIPDEMYTAIKNIKDRGGKVFWAIPEFGSGSCVNCNGNGHLAMQSITGGPYDSPPSTGEGECSISEYGKWFKARTRVFDCPVCQGNGSTAQTLKQPPPINKAVFDVRKLADSMRG